MKCQRKQGAVRRAKQTRKTLRRYDPIRGGILAEKNFKVNRLLGRAEGKFGPVRRLGRRLRATASHFGGRLRLGRKRCRERARLNPRAGAGRRRECLTAGGICPSFRFTFGRSPRVLYSSAWPVRHQTRTHKLRAQAYTSACAARQPMSQSVC